MKTYNIPTELLDLIPGYIERRKSEVADLQLFLENRDFESIEKIGHKLKGNGSSFGFDHITELGELLMIAARSRSVVQIQKLIGELDDEVVHIKQSPEVKFSE